MPTTSAEGVGRNAPRVLIVVARDRHDLYEYLQRGLAGFDDIEVILDRRVAPRNVPSAGTPDPDLRTRQDMADELQRRGFVMIHLW